MKLTIFIVVVLCICSSQSKKEHPKKPVHLKMDDMNKGKREAAIHHPVSFGGFGGQRLSHSPFSSSLGSSHFGGGGFSFGAPKIIGHSSSSDSHSFSAPQFPLFQPHAPSFGGASYSVPAQVSGHTPRYTSIGSLLKSGTMHAPVAIPQSSGHIGNTGPQIFGQSHLVSQPQPTYFVSKPSNLYGFSNPSLPSYSATKGLGAFASPGSHGSLSGLFSQSAGHGSPSFAAPSSSYGVPSFGGSHGSLGSQSFSLGGHGSFSGNSLSSQSSSPFAGFFDTNEKHVSSSLGSSGISSSYGAPSSSSSFKPSVYLGSSVASPSSSYGTPSLSNHGASLSSSYGVPSISTHDTHGSSSLGSNSLGSSSLGSSSFGSGSLSLSSNHGSLPFSLSESDRSKLLSGMPIYITANQFGGHASSDSLGSLSSGSHGSPSLSGSSEIPSAGHAAPAISFSHLSGSHSSPSASYGVPSLSHGSSDLLSSLGQASQSSSGYATHEPSESYGAPSSGHESLSSGFTSSIVHDSSSSSHGAPAIGYGTPSIHSSGSDFGSGGLSYEGIGTGKLDLSALSGGHAFGGSGLGGLASASSYGVPTSSYGVPTNSYGVPHFGSSEDSHDASSENKYNTIKYSSPLSISMTDKAKN